MSSQALQTLVPLAAIRAAAARIAEIARRTPLLAISPDPAARAVLVKCENLQVAGAFKIRGAANMLLQLDRADVDRGVITYSSGNHGQALACAARMLGTPALVVMPTTAPAVKVEGARAFGAEVVFAGTTTAERKREAERLAAERRLVIVPPFDHPAIIAGQGTIGLEILEQCADVRRIYVPAGGGGLIAGVAAAVKRLRPDVRVIGVEPSGAPKMSRSLEAGAPVTLASSSSIADGLLAIRPGDLTFAHVRAFVDEIITIEEAEIVDAIRLLAGSARLVAEPSGAVALAGLRQQLGEGPLDGPAVAVVSGGNVALERLAEWLLGDRIANSTPRPR
jgi:threonine dehydratase